jgi:hypothetical protein
MKLFADYEVGDTVAYFFEGYIIAKVIRRTACHAVLDNGHRFHRKTGFVIRFRCKVMDYSDPTIRQRLSERRMNPKYVRRTGA